LNDNRIIDRSAIEVLSSALERVTPRPLPYSEGELAVPLVPPADWSLSVRLSVSWRTDLTRTFAPSQDQEEAISMQSRPSRTLSYRMTSRESGEAHVIAQALMGYALAGGPVPMVQDQVAPTGTLVEGGNTRIFGDFRFGHFYVGQRVIITQRKPAKNYWDDVSIRATLRETSATSLVVDGLLPRALVAEDLVIPCIDADIVPSSSGVFVTDSVLQVDLTFQETSGPETLPASYPALAWASLGDLVAYSADGQPILDLPPDWTDGISVAVNRRVSTQPTGRSVAASAFGGPYFTFGLPFTSGSRKKAWDILRFFDACRGRAAQFFFLHPNQPWQLLTAPVGGSTTIDIRAVGTRFDLQTGFRLVAVIDTAGAVYIRQIASVASLPLQKAFRLTLASVLPAGPFLSVVPVHQTRLASDSLEQEWLTDAVSTTSISLEEIRDPSPASPVGGAARVRFESHRNLSPIALLEPQIWVCPGANAYAYDGGSLLVKSEVDPGSPSVCSRFFDVREGLPGLLRSDTVVSRPFLWARQRAGVLTNFSPARRAGGKPTAVFCQYALSTYEQAPSGPPLPLAAPLPWSNDTGWTLILNTNPKDTALAAVPSPTLVGQVLNEAFRVACGGVNAVVFSQDSVGSITVRNASTGSNVTASLIDSGNQNDSRSHSFTIVLRFDPSLGRFYCHVNGANAIAAGFLNVGSMLTSTPVQVFLGAYYNYPSPIMAPHLAFAVGSLNCVMSWDRALSPADIDLVGRDLAESFASPWQTPVYP
jgi:hypothetical protein